MNRLAFFFLIVCLVSTYNANSFSKEYGNPVNVNMLINVVDMKWHEVDSTHLRHPLTESLSCGLENGGNFSRN